MFSTPQEQYSQATTTSSYNSSPFDTMSLNTLKSERRNTHLSSNTNRKRRIPCHRTRTTAIEHKKAANV